jgi:hypothetical protein
MIAKNCLGPRAQVALLAMALVGGWMQLAVAADEAPAKAAEVAKPDAPAKAPEFVKAAGLDWYADYYDAYRAAASQQKLLLVNVTPGSPSSQQQNAEQWMANDAKLHAKLDSVVRLRVPANATIDVDGKPRTLLSFSAFSHLSGGPGFLIIDLTNKQAPYYGQTVSVLPFSGGKYYNWRGDYLATSLDLPPGTLTQRTMIWAVRVHPERPQSTWGQFNPALAGGATHQASYQASVGVQGHQGFESRFVQLSSATGTMGVSEVCAESWPSENLIDACLDCVDSWRHSSGHWQGVSSPHRAFGYDIRLGGNGIWYGTGIFAD